MTLIQKLLASVVPLALGFAACATSPDPACTLNETQSCACAGGVTGAQTCGASGQWSTCSCGSNGNGNGNGNGSGSGSGSGSGNGTAFHHGTVCSAPAFDCGSGTNLVCVVDNQGDTQGICRLACSTFSQCLNDPSASHAFDTSCCNITNGTSVCDNSLNLPPNSCQ